MKKKASKAIVLFLDKKKCCFWIKRYKNQASTDYKKQASRARKKSDPWGLQEENVLFLGSITMDRRKKNYGKGGFGV